RRHGGTLPQPTSWRQYGFDAEPGRSGVVGFRLFVRRRFGDRRLVRLAFFLTSLAFVLALGQPRNGGQPLALLEIDQANALGVAPDDADLVRSKSDHLAAAGDEHELIVVRHHAHADHPARLLGDPHRDDALAAAVGASVLVHAG